MKQEYKYILYLLGALAVLVLIEYFMPKPIDWSFTLARRDKIPYGTFVLDATLEDIFPAHQIVQSDQSLYLMDLDDQNLLILAQYFTPDSLDTDILLNHLQDGGQALVAANFYGGSLGDTLNLDTDYEVLSDILFLNDTVKAANDTLPTLTYDQTYFISYDTARTTVLAYDRQKHPVLLRMQHGEGFLLISSQPQQFTNYAMLYGGSAPAVAQTLSWLPNRDLYWTEYYQSGRLESPSPLRFILSQPALRWALYLTLAALALFMIFEAKRKQRPIPVEAPPTNTTLEFVGTVSNLFLRTRDHQNIAEKKIQYFLEEVRSRYRLDTTQLDADFAEKLAHKSGKSEEEVNALLASIRQAKRQQTLSADALVELSERIDELVERKQFDPNAKQGNVA